ncbi:MAG: fused MFS/spermidine synthase [Gammaproteobacteria bacterium]|nr:fused MFS/spermidine synthase [Gammaproteobacteria bacterium]MCB1923303.1 fused MFS/spermidine synthase [Gammaproteobacteria bacterium]
MADLGSLIFRTRDDDGDIDVYEDARCRYLTFGNQVEQSCVDLANPACLPYVYTQAIMLGLLLHPQPRRVLMLGVGGGSLLRALRAADPRLQITGVEQRQLVVDVARTYFGLPDDRRVRIAVDDATRFLQNDHDAYDLLITDLYLASGMHPEQVEVDFLQLCRARLAPDGILVMNQWASEFSHNRAAHGNLAAVFDTRVLNLHVQGGNIINFAFRGALPDVRREEFYAEAQALGLCLSIPLQRHARNLWRQNSEVLRGSRCRR